MSAGVERYKSRVGCEIDPSGWEMYKGPMGLGPIPVWVMIPPAVTHYIGSMATQYLPHTHTNTPSHKMRICPTTVKPPHALTHIGIL